MQRTPFSQTILGAILVAVIAGVILLVIQRMSGPDRDDKPAYTPPPIVVNPVQAPQPPPVVCDFLRSEDACIIWSHCRWNRPQNPTTAFEAAYGWCSQRG
jgi:hypothetical protein